MTDLETLKQILTRAGVIFTEAECQVNDVLGTELNIQEGQGPNNLGYAGFMTSWMFDQDGNLKTVGSWE